MSAITYVSAPGPMHTPWFGNGAVSRDMVVAALSSLLIYSWAMAVALPAERIEEMINMVVVPGGTIVSGEAVMPGAVVPA